MRDRTLRLWVIAVTAAAFGPYVVGGFRTEQIALYASAALAVPMMWRLRPTPVFAAIATLWCALVVVAVVGTAWTPTTRFKLGSFANGIDNMLVPLMALTTAALWSTTDRQRRLALDWLAGTVTVIVAVNTVVTIVSLKRQLPWLRNFWAAGGEVSTVAERALRNGRVSGIFNSPAQCGLMCSIALVLALWRWRWRTPNPRLFAVLSVAAVVGGLLAVSKIIFFAGVPVFGYLLWLDRQGRIRRVVRVAATGVAVVGVLSTGIIDWAGQNRLWSWVTFGGASDVARITALTSGRYGDGSTLGNVSGTVLDEAPMFGYGAQGVTEPLDSAWLELLVVAGLFGVGILVAVMAVMVWRCRTLARERRHPEYRVAGGLLAVAAIASFGVPAFTTNRGGTILWLALGLAVVHVHRAEPAEVERPTRSLQRTR